MEYSFEFFFFPWNWKFSTLEKRNQDARARRKSREVIKIFRENNNTLNYILGSQRGASRGGKRISEEHLSVWVLSSTTYNNWQSQTISTRLVIMTCQSPPSWRCVTCSNPTDAEVAAALCEKISVYVQFQIHISLMPGIPMANYIFMT